MKIVIAPDSFKGSLTAVEAVEAMTYGVRSVFPSAEIVKIPLADGGEGTSSVLVTAMGGENCECFVRDPLGRDIKAYYGVINTVGTQTAVIEVAEASGLMLVNEDERNALRASSYGTGQLIKDALDRGCRDFIIGLGGSATTDAGKGLLEALGVRFYDENGERLSAGGGSLRLLSRIDASGMDRRIKESRFMVLCDVENPLYGVNGAAYVFSPQKGATPEDVILLDEGLRRFSYCVKADLGLDVSQLSGGGAAGGIGTAMVTFLGAKLEPGAKTMLNVVKLEEKIKNADLILTGEGKIDCQTMMGKLLSVVMNAGTCEGVPVVAFAGVVEGEDELLRAGFSEIRSINRGCESIENVMDKDVATNRLSSAVAGFLKEL